MRLAQRYGNLNASNILPDVPLNDNAAEFIAELYALYEHHDESIETQDEYIESCERFLEPHRAFFEKITNGAHIDVEYSDVSSKFLDTVFNMSRVTTHTLRAESQLSLERLPSDRTITIPSEFESRLGIGYKSSGTIVNYGDIDYLGSYTNGTIINRGNVQGLGDEQRGGILINTADSDLSIEAHDIGYDAQSGVSINLGYAQSLANRASDSIVLNYGIAEHMFAKEMSIPSAPYFCVSANYGKITDFYLPVGSYESVHANLGTLNTLPAHVRDTYLDLNEDVIAAQSDTITDLVLRKDKTGIIYCAQRDEAYFTTPSDRPFIELSNAHVKSIPASFEQKARTHLQAYNVQHMPMNEQVDFLLQTDWEKFKQGMQSLDTELRGILYDA